MPEVEYQKIGSLAPHKQLKVQGPYVELTGKLEAVGDGLMTPTRLHVTGVPMEKYDDVPLPQGASVADTLQHVLNELNAPLEPSHFSRLVLSPTAVMGNHSEVSALNVHLCAGAKLEGAAKIEADVITAEPGINMVSLADQFGVDAPRLSASHILMPEVDVIPHANIQQTRGYDSRGAIHVRDVGEGARLHAQFGDIQVRDVNIEPKNAALAEISTEPGKDLLFTGNRVANARLWFEGKEPAMANELGGRIELIRNTHIEAKTIAPNARITTGDRVKAIDLMSDIETKPLSYRIGGEKKLRNGTPKLKITQGIGSGAVIKNMDIELATDKIAGDVTINNCSINVAKDEDGKYIDILKRLKELDDLGRLDASVTLDGKLHASLNPNKQIAELTGGWDIAKHGGMQGWLKHRKEQREGESDSPSR